MFKFDYEVAELTWENGQLVLHELGRRVPSKSQPTTSWDQPCAAETLEALVNQATLQPYCKTDVAVNDDELVPRMHHHNPTVAVGKLNESVAGTSDAQVPNSNNRTVEGSSHDQPSIKSGRDAVVSSCSGNPSLFMDPRVQQQDRDLGGRLLMSTSTGSPENTSSGRDCSNTTFPDHTVCHHRIQKRETKTVNEKAKSSILNKRKRTADIHNQSERKRRDKINQKLKTLQKLIPNSSKTDKASMLDEVIEHIKQLQMNIHTMSMMNMSPMMMSFIMQQQQQQLQLQKSMMNSMGMGMDMNAIGPCNIPTRFHPSPFMQMPCWNNHPADQVSTNATAGGPMPAFLTSQSPALNMDCYSRMAALYYQQMQNQLCGQFSKN